MRPLSSLSLTVITLIGVLTLLYGLLSACTGGLGVIAEVPAMAMLGGTYLAQGIVMMLFKSLNVLVCIAMVLAGGMALVTQRLGRWALVAALGAALVFDPLFWLVGIGASLITASGDIEVMLPGIILGSVMGMVTLGIKCIAYLVGMALLVFLGGMES